MNHMNQVFNRTSHTERIIPHFIGLLMLVFCSVVLTVPGWTGEGNHRHAHNPDKHLKRLTKQLGLTEAQQVKITPILKQKTLQLETLHQQMKEVRQKFRVQIESELTTEQIAIFKELRGNRKERREAYKEKHGKGYKGKHKSDGHEGGHHDDKHD